MSDEQTEHGNVLTPQQQMRDSALAYLVTLAGAERGPDCAKWAEFKEWLSDTAAFLETGTWPDRPKAKLEPIKGGRGG